MTSHRSLARRAAVVAATVTAAVALAACGDNSNDTSSGSAGHDMSSMTPKTSAPASTGSRNAQDVAFAQGMIVHHRQAVAMADLAPGRAKSQEVKDLAAKIKKAQDPEITTMSGWLKSWGEDVPAAGKSGMDHSGGDSMSGMMNDADMAKLDTLSGAAFDTAFLKMMIEHHQGAIAMAETEQSKGAYGPAKDLAKTIVTAQSAEISQMNTMLGK
ncbi:lipoprotein [Streptomyces zinciresistens K42]|uniref:Lipoprotein n=1 Tax=Streptomyces zinciresistens K42 TaxID=700597 RepID=G2GP20_9ACTN|nr:DUF305 domain-containing protein [Streptomyces zinciresistens]EGX54748.1 lipoprotein [Streptomyces zinciresistens K42]